MASPAHAGKDPIITSSSALPFIKIKGLAVWGGKTQLFRNRFIGFNKATKIGRKQSLFSMHKSMSDYIPMAELYDTTLENIEDGALAYIFDPLPGWANLDDCGLYPCTAPLNVLMNFRDTTFVGTTPSWASAAFQVISNNPDFAPFVNPSCTQNLEMNAYVC